MTESKIDLIAKLLAKAESTTPEEAEALMEHAVRLMQKYAIDQATIDERRRIQGQTSEQIVERKVFFDGTYAAANMHLGACIVWALGSMRVLEAKRNSTRILFIVGYESDVAQAEVLVRSLTVQAAIAMRSWWQHARAGYDSPWIADSAKRQARIQFIRAFGDAVHAKIAANRLQVIEEAGSGTDLVLVSRKSRVDDFVDAQNLRKARTGRTKSQTDWEAQAAGHRAGQDANTGERAVSQGRGLPAGRS